MRAMHGCQLKPCAPYYQRLLNSSQECRYDKQVAHGGPCFVTRGSAQAAHTIEPWAQELLL